MAQQYELLFTYILHIRPWEIGLLTARQFDDAVDWIDAYLESRGGE